MYSKIIQLVLSSLVVVLLLACQKETTANRTMQDSLVESADGKSYSVKCLRGVSPSTMSKCEVSVGESSRGAVGLNAYGYYDYSMVYYWNILAFNQNDFCSYIWGVSSCYNYFGYGNYIPTYNYNSCSGSYLGNYNYSSIPYYCYWNYSTATNLLKMKATPIVGVNGTNLMVYISLDSYGRVMRKKCDYPSGLNCSSQIISYISGTELSSIQSLISAASTGTIYKLESEVACFAAATETRVFTANNAAIFLGSANYSCANGTQYYNNTVAAQQLVQQLNTWAQIQ